jgi:demethylmenaquinone methyltransferase/2-methoxy-6-polyprenyl-1,4-benzoquinol methylase
VGNEYYDPGEHRADQVNRLFTRVARRYDLMNDLMSFGLHRYWKAQVLRLANARPGERALDLCCGTGDLVFALARQSAEVVGLDFNAEMLAVAEARKNRSSPPPRHVQFIQGDAQRLPQAADQFDIVTIAYGLRNLASLETGLREMHRVLKPGGRALILDFGKPTNPAWRSIYFGYLRLFVPCLGLLCCGSAAAYSYILESLIHYPAQVGVAESMRNLGFEQVRIHELLGGIMSINYGLKPVRS